MRHVYIGVRNTYLQAVVIAVPGQRRELSRDGLGVRRKACRWRGQTGQSVAHYAPYVYPNNVHTQEGSAKAPKTEKISN